MISFKQTCAPSLTKVNPRLVKPYMQLWSLNVGLILHALIWLSLMMMMMPETQHGYGTHSWDIPLSVLTAADIRVKNPIGSIIRQNFSNMPQLINASWRSYRLLPDNSFREAIHSIALPPYFSCGQEIQISYTSSWQSTFSFTSLQPESPSGCYTYAPSSMLEPALFAPKIISLW